MVGLVGRVTGGGVDDGGDHEVDGDDVDGALGHAGELLQQAAGVGDDHRLGHAEAADPARERLVDRRLDDRRAHDRHRDVAAVLQQRPLAERLRVGVGVGPAERRGAGPARPPPSAPSPTRRGAARSWRPARGCRRRRARARASLRKRTSASGRRLSASASARARRAPSTSPRQSTSMKNGLSCTGISGAAPRRLPAT